LAEHVQRLSSNKIPRIILHFRIEGNIQWQYHYLFDILHQFEDIGVPNVVDGRQG
jgi:hypothetical protein